MGPKTNPKDAPKEPAVGAKFAYVSAGQKSNLCKLVINLNCNMEILLDSVKRQMSKKIDERILQFKTATIQSTIGNLQPGAPVADAETANGKVDNNELIIQKFQEIQQALAGDDGYIDLIDAATNSAVGCNQKLNSLASEDILQQAASYVLGRSKPNVEQFIFDINAEVSSNPAALTTQQSMKK